MGVWKDATGKYSKAPDAVTKRIVDGCGAFAAAGGFLPLVEWLWRDLAVDDDVVAGSVSHALASQPDVMKLLDHAESSSSSISGNSRKPSDRSG